MSADGGERKLTASEELKPAPALRPGLGGVTHTHRGVRHFSTCAAG
jgi:hypothetical protein